MIVGADIGGHHIAAALVGDPRRGIDRDSLRHRDVDCRAAQDTLIAAWAAELDAAIDDAPQAVEGVGIAMPGPFDYRAGVAYFSGDNAKFGSLNGVDVGAALQAAMRNPRPIRFINDATAFAVGCYAMGLADGAHRTLGVTLGTGLGSAFLEDGIPVVSGDAVPPHGALWDAPYRGSIADDYVSARWLLAEGERVTGRRHKGVAQLADAVRGGEPGSDGIFPAYGDMLGEIIAPWIVKFAVDAIVLGGRISGALDLFGPALRNRIAATGRTPAIAQHFETEDAAIAGGALTFDPAFWAVAQHRLPAR